jgi:hypothetical protein
MYLIVNYDRFWRHEEIFSDFNKAKRIYNKINDQYAVIEYYSKEYRRKVVWPKHKIQKTVK